MGEVSGVEAESFPDVGKALCFVFGGAEMGVGQGGWGWSSGFGPWFFYYK